MNEGGGSSSAEPARTHGRWTAPDDALVHHARLGPPRADSAGHERTPACPSQE